MFAPPKQAHDDSQCDRSQNHPNDKLANGKTNRRTATGNDDLHC
jgi:hypothetical protein